MRKVRLENRARERERKRQRKNLYTLDKVGKRSKIFSDLLEDWCG